ncbi:MULTISPECIES: hypothetical protein [unclassified Streptosporangium]|uniref:hypothetical protein n=1 Tax=unclassified Streptosporangium TaxID=2632669 RepID=UPI002E2E3CF1|nr:MULTISPECIES: hypothetical protein [unclassified Streptosporangium]
MTTGTARTTIRLAAAGTAAGLVLATAFAGGTALAETGGAGARIPKNFLLHEPQARKPVRYPEEEKWTISQRLGGNLEINPCDLRRPADRDRVAMRTVVYQAPEHRSGEQLVIYRSTAAARRALAGLLGQVERCARVKYEGTVFRSWAEPVRAGDRAVRIAGQSYDAKGARPAIGGHRAVVVREGRAVAIYLLAGEYGRVRDSDFTRQLKNARRMAVKICSLPGVC